MSLVKNLGRVCWYAAQVKKSLYVVTSSVVLLVWFYIIMSIRSKGLVSQVEGWAAAAWSSVAEAVQHWQA